MGIRVPPILTGTAEAQVRQIVIQTLMVTLVPPTGTTMDSLSALHQATPTPLETLPLSSAAITPTPQSGLGSTQLTLLSNAFYSLTNDSYSLSSSHYSLTNAD